jgi:hypothetical protein
MGAQFGNLVWAHLLGTCRDDKGVLEVGCLSLWELCEGNLEGGLPCRGPWRIGRKSYGNGAFLFIGAPFGEPGGGLIYRESRDGASLSKEAPWKGTLGNSFTGDPG